MKEGDGGSGGGDMGGGDMPQSQGTSVPSNRSGATPTTTSVKTDSSVVVNPAGAWTYTIESPQGGGGSLNINREGDSYSGTIINNRNNKEIPLENVILQGNGLSFTYETSFGPNTNTVKVVLAVNEKTLEGTMSTGQFGSFPMKGKRSTE